MNSSPEFTADVIYDTEQRTRIDDVTVCLSVDSLTIENDSFERTIPLTDVFDIRLGQPPLAVAGEIKSKTLTVGRGNPAEATENQEFYFFTGEESTVTSMAELLYRLLLNETEVAVRHPTEIGGRRLNSSFTLGDLHISDRSVAFRNVDVSFKVDVDNIIEFSSFERELLGEMRDIIEVRYIKGGRSIVFEVSISSRRKHNILGRYLRLRYTKLLREISPIDISSAETKALAVLYTMQGEANLQTLLNGRSESSLEVLKFLQKRGLITASEGYVRLTPKGWIIITSQLQEGNSAQMSAKKEQISV